MLLTTAVFADGVFPDLPEGHWAYTSVDKMVNDGRVNGFPFKFGKNLIICLIIGIIAGLIVALVLKGQLKSVRKQNQANVYTKPGSMHLTVQNDFFLYRTVDRRQKSSNSSSGSSPSQGSSSGSF